MRCVPCCCCARAAQARPLTVQADLQPVVEFLRNTGMDSQAVVTVRACCPHT